MFDEGPATAPKPARRAVSLGLDILSEMPDRASLPATHCVGSTRSGWTTAGVMKPTDKEAIETGMVGTREKRDRERPSGMPACINAVNQP